MPLPPAQVTKAVIQRYARLWSRHHDELGKRPLVLPTGEFFPDEFTPDEESVILLASRMQEYAGMDDVPIRATIVGNTPTPSSSSCSSGGCGVPQAAGDGLARLVDTGDGWLLQVPAAELRHSVALTTNLARSLAFIFLVETQREDEVIEPPVDVTADFVAVALGFGALMLQGSYIYAKSCGGPQVASVTKVGTAELAIGTALFASLADHDLGPALKELDPTQRDLLNEARGLMRGNKRMLADLIDDPKHIADGHFTLNQAKSRVGELLGKIFGTKSDSDFPPLSVDLEASELEDLLIDMPPSSSISRRPTSGAEASADPEHDEIKALVSQALDEARA